jgi:Na+/H+ antiporter NhaD/arsenite permease-like protein
MAFKPEEFTSDANRDAAEAMVRYHEADIRRGNVAQEELGVAFLIGSPSQMAFILAISAGSVFWGACTYIGNGPNFMVKSIAEAAGVKTPGFLEYIYKYTLPILIPIYVVVWLVAFMGK